MKMVSSASSLTWDRWRSSIPLHGDRTTLRELRGSDGVFLEALFLDPEVHRFVVGLPQTVEKIHEYSEWAERMRHEGRHLCLAIVLDARVIGIIQAWPLEPTAKTVEWGFILARAYWGQGLLQDAARTFVTLAVTLGVERLEARTAARNARGVATLRRLGAKREGVLRQAFVFDRQRTDGVLWSILAAEWPVQRNQLRSATGIGAS